MLKGKAYRGGFALPTVLISSVVMLIVLAVSVSSVTSVRLTLKAQYYEQLAKVAGEAGVAYAKACLAQNSNKPLWTDTTPLTPDSDCSGNSTLPANSCPNDARCSVVSNVNFRSSFKVPRPALDTNGRALTIPNTGYVELLRTSTNEVWRKYSQPAVQAAAVPDLCSGAATSGLGWQNAVVTTAQDSIATASSAQSISISNSTVPAGKMYFREDFTVTSPGTYTLSARTADTTERAQVYIDGNSLIATLGSTITNTVNLAVGCHTITAEFTNKVLTPQAARFTASLQKSGQAPIMTTDSSWRVSAGASVHFSQPDFYTDTSIWQPVVDNIYPTGQAANGSWQGTGDAFTRMVSPPSNGCSSTCPGLSSGYMRDSKDFYLSSDTNVKVAALCDDECSVYIDGQTVIGQNKWNSITQQSLTLGPGAHHVAVRIYNINAGASGAAITVLNRDSGAVLTRTDRTWLGANAWTSGLNATSSDIRSYEASYYPSPDEIARPTTLDFLVVAGGGGGGTNVGGGGGGGGVISRSDVQLGVGTYTVTVGGGGAAGTNSGTTTAARGQNGGNSVFSSYTAIGGGGGASRDTGPVASSGGSGGGGSGTIGGGRDVGASGTSGQGYDGGNGTPADQGYYSKGGGGGGAGGSGTDASNSFAGTGGAGIMSYITGSLQSFGGGGAAASFTGYGTSGISADGGADAGTGTAAANRGGGGSTNGIGGSGVVFIRIKTGSMSVSTTNSPVTTTATIDGINYTIYKFTVSGTFKINSIN